MPDLLVLCYHSVSDTWDHEMGTRPADLRRHLLAVRRRGYRPATFTESVLSPRTSKTVVVTFDDAFANVYSAAFPILQELDFPATLFVPTFFPSSGKPLAWHGFEPGPGVLPADLVPAPWHHIAELRDAGWEIGSHTRTHPRLTKLDDAAALAELRQSKAECEERLGSSCQSLAYPFGDFDARIIGLAAEAGYVCAGTLDRGTNRQPLAVGRVGVYRKDAAARFAAKTSWISRTAAAEKVIALGRSSSRQLAHSARALRRSTP